MNSSTRFSVGVTVILLSAVTPHANLRQPLAVLAASVGKPTGQTVFRASTTIVPIDVRVLDKRGMPVTDLKASDFTVVEDGLRQEIKQFSSMALTPSTPQPGDLLRRTTAATASLVPKNRRLFLILLGRGRLEQVSKSMQALLSFVRERLLPQDQVALMAWNRATDFTTDHEQVARVLERFRAKHQDIEFELGLYFSGLRGLYAGRAIPPKLQLKIDEVFNGPAGPDARTVLPSASTKAAETAATARLNDQLQRQSELQSNNQLFKNFGGSDLALSDLMAGNSTGQDFDAYVALNRQTMQDVGNLYAGIDYLRFIDGEKHLIFVTEQGILMPSADDDEGLAAMAADARVAIDTIQTGGVATIMVEGMPVVPNGFALAALRTVSEMSGGQVSVSNYGAEAIDRIVHSTEFGYLLGYTPINVNMNGRLRHIKVSVNRPGVDVSYRRAYYARDDIELFDPRRTIATTRMTAALNLVETIDDLKLSIKTTNVKVGADRALDLDVTVAADKLVFANVNGQHLAAISYAAICVDQDGRGVGTEWKTVDLAVPDDEFPDVKRHGLKFNIRALVAMPPTSVKVIVYDYGSDLLGSKIQRVR